MGPCLAASRMDVRGIANHKIRVTRVCIAKVCDVSAVDLPAIAPSVRLEVLKCHSGGDFVDVDEHDPACTSLSNQGQTDGTDARAEIVSESGLSRPERRRGLVGAAREVRQDQGIDVGSISFTTFRLKEHEAAVEQGVLRGVAGRDDRIRK